jgi:hypothetical protein
MLTVLLSRVWIQEIKHMMLMLMLVNAWFILTCTQKSRYIYKSCITIFTECTAISIRTNPLHRQQSKPALLTSRASFFACGDEFPSTLVSSLPTTAPPLCFYPSHPFIPHSSNYIIYRDDINNLGRLHLGHLQHKKTNFILTLESSVT